MALPGVGSAVAVFLLLSTGDVIDSCRAGEFGPEYVALTAVWLVGIGLLGMMVWNA